MLVFNLGRSTIGPDLCSSKSSAQQECSFDKVLSPLLMLEDGKDVCGQAVKRYPGSNDQKRRSRLVHRSKTGLDEMHLAHCITSAALEQLEILADAQRPFLLAAGWVLRKLLKRFVIV